MRKGVAGCHKQSTMDFRVVEARFHAFFRVKSVVVMFKSKVGLFTWKANLMVQVNFSALFEQHDFSPLPSNEIPVNPRHESRLRINS